MNRRNFFTLLQSRWAEGKFVCVGLDTDYNKIPKIMRSTNAARAIWTFNEAIVDATKDLVCAYKPNIAFYERYGDEGMKALWHTIGNIQHEAPGVPIILDAKRGDIGNTNLNYVEEAFKYFDADAITINPYLGREALQPFLDKKNKGIFVLCRTSNPGAGEFQDLMVTTKSTVKGSKLNFTKPLYETVAMNVTRDWNTNRNCGLVAGATHPDELATIRAIANDHMPLLIPGIGAQGGDIKKTVLAGRNSANEGMIINSSSAIIFASRGKNFAEKAREATIDLSDQINKYRLM